MRRTITIAAAVILVALGLFGAAQPLAQPLPQPSAAIPQPVIGPAPAWVTPVALPSAPSDASDAPVRVLLQDEQIFLEAGRQTYYSETALFVQNPAGLAAGSIVLPWRPETDVLTIHKVHIRRGDQVIDVLASGQTFTVLRREQNLELATLDGILTATMQPEDLQVGDIIHVAASTVRRDAVLGDNVEVAGAGWNGLPVARAHFSVQWPETLHVDRRITSAMPAGRLTRRNGLVRFELSQNNVEPLAPPNGAPPRFGIVRLASFTTFTSWSDVAMLMAPLYERASTLPADGRLQAEVARIRERTTDPVERAEAALALVQDRVRYVALLMGEGGLVPADAETTWTRRFGDCKGKTALLLALLHALDIQAEPVAVSVALGDGLDQRLPMVGWFDHVLVRATIGGRTYWLDGTRTGDTRLNGVQTPDFGWGLPLVRENAALVRMTPEALDTPDSETIVRIDASAGLLSRAPIHVDLIFRGDQAVAGNMYYANVTGAARDNTLRQYWREQYRNIEISSASVTFDAAARELRFVMDGAVTLDWSGGGYAPSDTDVGYSADFHRDAGVNSDAPFAVPFPYYNRLVQTVLLPSTPAAFRVINGEEVNQTVAGISYQRRAAITGNVFRVELNERSVAPEFPASEAPVAQATLHALADRTVRLMAPASYRTTDGDAAAQAATTPTDAAGFLRRGTFYLRRNQLDEGIADLTRAIELDPRNAEALASRGLAYASRGEIAAGTRDIEAAIAADPRNAMALQARGFLARRAGAPADAISAYTSALQLNPNDASALGGRASAYHAVGDEDRALADSEAALRLQPNAVDLYLLRANIYRRRGDLARAAAEAEALRVAMPDTAFAQVTAARIFAATNRPDDAMRAFDRAIEIDPQPYVYLNRAQSRPLSDVQQRFADADAALQLDPNSAEALTFRAGQFSAQRDYQSAIRDLSAAVRGDPENAMLLVQRGVNHALAGQQALAEADFAAARALARQPIELNNMCWTKATAGVALESALADCDAAVAQMPDAPAYLDSRAFVLLRLGRTDEAIEVYDRVLALAPRQALSLYGRGLAWDRKGDRARAEADMTAAIAIQSDIGELFARYGLSPGTPR